MSLLDKHRGQYLSGEALAAHLRVTRSSVWKAINALRHDGLMIHAVTNKGYALSPENDLLTLPGIQKHLSNPSLFIPELYPVLPSTQTALRDRTHAREGLVIAANEQTAGSGRRDRPFFSPPHTGLYFSLLLKPLMTPADTAFLTAAAAVSVCRAIEKISDKHPKIKWVNDIFLDGKKVCGILTHASFSLEDNRAEYVLLGIGMNVYPPRKGFPEELNSLAGAVFPSPQGGLKNRLLAEILNAFQKLYSPLDPAALTDMYKAYSCILGQPILVRSPDNTLNATAMDIDSQCRLIVRYENGQTDTLSFQEIIIPSVTIP